MGKKLYVGNMTYEVGNANLEQMFGMHGTVVGVNIIMDRSTGRNKGFGFVEMSTEEEAQAAITALDGQDCGGRTLKVNEAKARSDSGGGRAGGRSRY